MHRPTSAIYSFPILLTFALHPAAGSVKVVATQSSDTPLTFSESGSFLAAANFNGPSDTRGTNVFQGETLGTSASPATWSLNGLSVSIAASSSGTLATATLPNPTDDLYLTEIFAPNQATMALTIGGLNPAQKYLMQFPHGENRTILYSNNQSFIDSSNNSAVIPLSFGNSSTTPNGQKFTLTTIIVSGSTSLTYDMPTSDSSGTRGPSFDAFSVRVVPEPLASFALLYLAPIVLRRRSV